MKETIEQQAERMLLQFPYPIVWETGERRKQIIDYIAAELRKARANDDSLVQLQNAIDQVAIIIADLRAANDDRHRALATAQLFAWLKD